MDRKTIYIVLVACLVIYYMRKVQAAQALMVRYLLPQNIRISKGAVMFNLPVVITNPTGTPITLDRYNMRVDLEGYPIGTAYGTIRTRLLEGGDTTILANVVVPLDALVTLMANLRQIGSSIDCRFVGHIFAEMLTIPVDTIINIPLPPILQKNG
jgi:sporulation-control protein spo0M